MDPTEGVRATVWTTSQPPLSTSVYLDRRFTPTQPPSSPPPCLLLPALRRSNAVVQVLHDVWYGDMYKWLAINSYDRSESWKVPSNSLVEMAIVLEI